MWSFPPFRGVLVRVSVVLMTKLLLGKKTFNPPSSFNNERPSNGTVKIKNSICAFHAMNSIKILDIMHSEKPTT